MARTGAGSRGVKAGSMRHIGTRFGLRLNTGLNKETRVSDAVRTMGTNLERRDVTLAGRRSTSPQDDDSGPPLPNHVIKIT